MKTSFTFLVLATAICGSSAFTGFSSLTGRNTNSLLLLPLSLSKDDEGTRIDKSLVSSSTTTTTRRRFFLQSIGTLTTTTGVVMGGFQQSALAIPLVTVDEFGTIVQDSPLSIDIVEFSGPKGETVIVKLVDGTSFGIKDIVESSTDPRSPLKVAATCRESGIRTKFVDLEALMSKSPKKKLYTNQRVQEAAEKTRLQQERMRQDEEDRLRALQQMEQQE